MRHPNTIFGTCLLCLFAGAAPAQTTAPIGTASADGPGLLSRSWHSATDWQAWTETGHWRFALAPVSVHFRYNAEHHNAWAIGIERQRPDQWLAGISAFRNSFGQPSAYAYVGRRFPGLLGQPQLFGQLSAGVIYGYTGKYKNKLPMNINGFAPGALVTAGWQFTPRSAVAVHLLGDAGAMLQFSWDLN